MGGLALKNTYTRRYEVAEFHELVRELKDALSPQFGDAVVPQYFRSKESFGDCDILVDSSRRPVDMRVYIHEVFAPNELVHNGDVWSFDLKECQVDLILTKPENMVSAYNYFSWNDLGNLMGRLAHKFNVKYGFDGLRYVYRGNGRIRGEITLTKDVSDVCKFLGLDHSVFAGGFNSLEEVFNFVRSSAYFSPWLYDMDTLNRINRERNVKRKTYMTFLEWVAPMKDAGKDSYYRFHPNKDVYLGYIEAHFPGFMAKYMAMDDAEALHEQAREKFNGEIVMATYGLSGPVLGRALQRFKEQVSTGGTGFQEYILETPEGEIMRAFEKANAGEVWLS